MHQKSGRELLDGDADPEHQVDEEELDRQVHHALHRRGHRRRGRTVLALDNAHLRFF